MKVSNCTSMSIDAIHNNYCQGPCRKGNCIQTCNTHISILEKSIIYVNKILLEKSHNSFSE